MVKAYLFHRDRVEGTKVLARHERSDERGQDLFDPSALDKDIEHIAILIYSPPERVRFPVDLQVHFIQVPFVTKRGRLWNGCGKFFCVR